MNVADWVVRDEPSRLVEEMSENALPNISHLVGRRGVLQYRRATVQFETYLYLGVEDLLISASLVDAETEMPSWVDTMEDATLERPSGDAYMEVVEGLLDLVSDNAFAMISRIFAQVRVDRLSTDFLVALLRLTYSERHQIKAWNDLLDRVSFELKRRNDVDVTLELTGLYDGDHPE